MSNIYRYLTGKVTITVPHNGRALTATGRNATDANRKLELAKSSR